MLLGALLFAVSRNPGPPPTIGGEDDYNDICPFDFKEGEKS